MPRAPDTRPSGASNFCRLQSPAGPPGPPGPTWEERARLGSGARPQPVRLRPGPRLRSGTGPLPLGVSARKEDGGGGHVAAPAGPDTGAEPGRCGRKVFGFLSPWAAFPLKRGLPVPRVCAQVPQVLPDSCDPADCSPPGSSAHGILRAGTLEWAASLPPPAIPGPGIRPRTGILFLGTPSPLWATGHLKALGGPWQVGTLHAIHGVLKASLLKWFSIPFFSGSCFVRTLHHDPSVLLGWPYMAWLSFIELDKAVVHVIRLVSFL